MCVSPRRTGGCARVFREDARNSFSERTCTVELYVERTPRRTIRNIAAWRGAPLVPEVTRVRGGSSSSSVEGAACESSKGLSYARSVEEAPPPLISFEKPGWWTPAINFLLISRDIVTDLLPTRCEDRAVGADRSPSLDRLARCRRPRSPRPLAVRRPTYRVPPPARAAHYLPHRGAPWRGERSYWRARAGECAATVHLTLLPAAPPPQAWLLQQVLMRTA